MLILGSICIDCGIAEGLDYTDDKTQIHYTSDAQFIGTGTSKSISHKFISDTPQRTFTNVRSFPQKELLHATTSRRQKYYLLDKSFVHVWEL